jgi:hypothetical protein
MTDFLFADDQDKDRRSKIFGTPEFRQAYRRNPNFASLPQIKLV